MLQNPMWERGTLSGLIAWLEGKPRDGTYNYADCANCLIAQYMAGIELHNFPEEMTAIYRGTDEHKIARGFNLNSGHPQTFGEALERAYAARALIAA